MTDPELVELLKQGSEVWNRWREQQPEDVRIDLSGADLGGANLSGADLREANLYEAKLGGTNLNGADLSHGYFGGAILADTNLSFANLREADFFRTKTIDTTFFTGANLANAHFFLTDFSFAELGEADLTGAHLYSTDLSTVNLSGARLNNTHLYHVNLNDANLSETDFSGATIDMTVFGNLDLRKTIGLETISHKGPSTIGINTIERSQGNIPEIFLRGAGLSDIFIEYARSLITRPIQYHSCFISYSSEDETLAQRLYADLQAQGVRCWFAPEDMKIGDKIRSRIDEAIHTQDKLLLLLSEHALASDWVEDEVETALEKERHQQREVLFPIRLDNIVIQTTQAWAAKLRRQRHIGDFTKWLDPQEYQHAFDRLLKDLKKADDRNI